MKQSILACVLGVMVSTGCSTLPASNRALSRSIVRILAPDERGGGTGFMVEYSRGTALVTNAHVCDAGQDGRVLIEQFGRKTIARIVRISPDYDLCEVHADLDIPALPMAQSEPEKFERIKVLGHPQLHQVTLAEGHYIGETIIGIGSAMPESGVCPDQASPEAGFFGPYCVRRYTLGETTVTIFPGNSGSPALDEQGRVVGVFNAASSETNRGAIVPLRHLREFLESN